MNVQFTNETPRPLMTVRAALFWSILVFPRIAVAQSGGTPIPSPRAAPSTEPIRVTVADGIADASLFQDWGRERDPVVAAVFSLAPGHEQWIEVQIAGTTYAYLAIVTLMRDGRAFGPESEPFICECDSVTLLERIDEEITMSLSLLKLEAEVVQEVETETEAETEAETSSSSTVDTHRRSRLGPLGYTGIGVSALAAGMLGGGISLVLRPEEIRRMPTMVVERSTRAPGISLVVVGSVALAAGVSLLVVDLVRRRKSRVSALPTVGTRFGGLALKGSF